VPAALLSELNPRAHQDDAELVVRAQQGEEFAFELLFRRHAQFVAAVAFRVGRSRDEVDDVVQETFVLAFRRLAQLNDPKAFRGWLAQIAISLLHRRFRFSRLFRLFRDDVEEEQTLATMVSDAASPDVRAQLAQVDAAVAKLPKDQRTAWTLRFVLGCTLEEVAVGCDCSLATAKRRLAAADEAVREVITVELER
jgi:RNA polymerase sigma-70 factor (ECF subfamily)